MLFNKIISIEVNIGKIDEFNKVTFSRPVSHLLPIPIVKQRLFTYLFLARLINPSKLYIFPSVYIDQ